MNKNTIVTVVIAILVILVLCDFYSGRKKATKEDMLSFDEQCAILEER